MVEEASVVKVMAEVGPVAVDLEAAELVVEAVGGVAVELGYWEACMALALGSEVRT